MPDELWAEVFGVLPALFWVGFALVALFVLRRALIDTVLPRLTEVSGLGFTARLSGAGRLLEKASKPRNAEDTYPKPGRPERHAVLRRLEHAVPYLDGGRVMWVDDRPEGNRYLIELFEELGMRVDLAVATDGALELLRLREYDFVITDIRRGGDDHAGADMIGVFRENDIDLPVVVFSAGFDSLRGTDPMVFGATARIDGVVHYAIDVMERIRLSDG